MGYAEFRLVKTTYHKNHGADRVCFTHHPNSVICSSKYNLDSNGGELHLMRLILSNFFFYYKANDIFFVLSFQSR